MITNLRKEIQIIFFQFKFNLQLKKFLREGYIDKVSSIDVYENIDTKNLGNG